MIEVVGNLFEPPAELNVSAIVITTNGDTRQDGAAVMGRGVALEAKRRWPGIEYRLGDLLRKDGNHVHRLTTNGRVALGADMGRQYRAIPCAPNRRQWRTSHIEVPYDIYSLPVKHDWRCKADLELIKQSVMQLKALLPSDAVIALPRPGCGNGRLAWADVRPILAWYLDGRRFIIIEKNP